MSDFDLRPQLGSDDEGTAPHAARPHVRPEAPRRPLHPTASASLGRVGLFVLGGVTLVDFIYGLAVTSPWFGGGGVVLPVILFFLLPGIVSAMGMVTLVMAMLELRFCDQVALVPGQPQPIRNGARAGLWRGAILLTCTYPVVASVVAVAASLRSPSF